MVFSCDCLSGCGCGTRLSIVIASKQFCNNRTSQGVSCLRISGADGSKSLPRLSEELTSNAAHRSCRSSSSSKEPFSKIAMSSFGGIGCGVIFLASNIVLALSKRRRARFTRYIRIVSRIRSPASFAPGSRSALIKSPNGSIKPAAVPFAIASRFSASSDMCAGPAFPPDLTRGRSSFQGRNSGTDGTLTFCAGICGTSGSSPASPPLHPLDVNLGAGPFFSPRRVPRPSRVLCERAGLLAHIPMTRGLARSFITHLWCIRKSGGPHPAARNPAPPDSPVTEIPRTVRIATEVCSRYPHDRLSATK